MPPLSPAVLDALEDHDAEHDDEADAHDDGEGKEVGVDVKRLVVCQSDHESPSSLLICVMGHQLGPISVANEYRGDHVIPVPSYERIIYEF